MEAEGGTVRAGLISAWPGRTEYEQIARTAAIIRNQSVRTVSGGERGPEPTRRFRTGPRERVAVSVGASVAFERNARFDSSGVAWWENQQRAIVPAKMRDETDTAVR